MASFIKTFTSLTVVFDDGTSGTIYNTDPNYDTAISALRAADWAKVQAAMTPVEAVRKAAASHDNVTVEDDTVSYKGNAVHGTLTRRIVEMVRDGIDIKPMVLFLENLMLNPGFKIVKELRLYDFLEFGQMPITEDGCFLAYRRISTDYKDLHTRTVDNSIGAIVEMERNQVDDDDDNVCSSGLHFCSRGYLSFYGTGGEARTVLVKINPRDVVAIPKDYNNTKGRCCRYEVIKELEYMNEEQIERNFYPTYTEEDYQDSGYEDDYGYDDEADEPPYIAQCDPETGEVINYWGSVMAASQALSIPPSYIQRVIRGDRKSTGGYAWRLDHDHS
jgi:hypothetical protein